MTTPRDDLSLAFVNTRLWRGRARPTETLTAPDDLSAWWKAETGEALPAPEAGWFGAVLHLREALHGLFAARAGQAPPPACDLAVLNAALAAAPARRHLAWAGDGLDWEVEAPSPWDSARARLLWSAAELLTGPRRERVRQCDNPECRYLFLDASKAGNRRWCDMSSCGNRAKAHRHYRRRREAEAG
jgi:predicted RNA-binding Zn ribbon-like protein